MSNFDFITLNESINIFIKNNIIQLSESDLELII
jgi:hypothetical protein